MEYSGIILNVKEIQEQMPNINVMNETDFNNLRNSIIFYIEIYSDDLPRD